MSNFIHKGGFILLSDRELKNEMERFEVLCRPCCYQAQRLVWFEQPEIVMAEARYQLLLLLLAFDHRYAVPVEAYLKQMLPQRMLNWARKEAQHLGREKQSEEEGDFEATNGGRINLCEMAVEAERNFDSVSWWQGAQLLLTARQRQVMNSVLRGATEREIAKHLGISCAAVHRIKTQAQKKLRVEWEKVEKDG